ncbi:hypothetical protein HPB51_000486 [Rhipicephalus microplus]|uniref:Reverse transcriptase zinc-binding domain-containing protein n=1 Tax=Rhipicephalus microplus TaxID=6941 RepID=A0A9J6D3K3_RHIMP|nr:hypothetical protein HPB51_000486 [Rhipicephalus microplus]
MPISSYISADLACVTQWLLTPQNGAVKRGISEYTGKIAVELCADLTNHCFFALTRTRYALPAALEFSQCVRFTHKTGVRLLKALRKCEQQAFLTLDTTILLGLPREKGGWNISSVVALADTYALKTTLKVLQLQEDHPARKLATYFLGVQGRLFLQTQPAGPKAINPTPFYRHVVGIYKRIAALNLDTLILEVRNTELTQELLVNSGCEVKNPGFPWVLLTPSWLPGSIQDVVWRYGWSVLPTADRMYKWHYVRSEQCVHCGMFEDNKHALLACRVAKTFWSLVDRAYHPLGVDRFLKRKRCPNGALALLVLTADLTTIGVTCFAAAGD